MDRRFELTISVWYPSGRPLPDSYNEWVEYAFDQPHPPMGVTQLERVVETQHPPSNDVVLKRREKKGEKSLWQ